LARDFLPLFNLPESMALIRGLNEQEPYWQRVLEYCVAGGFQAVLDQYAHMLKESLGLCGKSSRTIAEQIAKEMRDAVTLRTSSLGVDSIEVGSDGKGIHSETRMMRGRFALRFGEERAENGEEPTRADAVRKAFNSPFWPFILASTSVGQEGLDFHTYCHAVVHWNLPSNPVDLEQREGRVHRYKGHAVRKNLAARYGQTASCYHATDPWRQLFIADSIAKIIRIRMVQKLSRMSQQLSEGRKDDRKLLR
jgi:hypothetical protein